MTTIDCTQCENRGRVHLESQETYCDQCIYQSMSWRKDLFKQKRPPNCGTSYCSCIECVMRPSTCTWRQDNDPDMPDTYQATCGAMWTFTDGGPTDNGMRFCPECGKPLTEEKAHSEGSAP